MTIATMAVIGVSFCAILGLVASAAHLLLLWENRRHWRVEFRRSPPIWVPRALIIVPCKGKDHRIKKNLSSFLAQDHPNYEVSFVVEDPKDPVVPLIEKLINKHRSKLVLRLVVAGKTESSGQKIHNLLAATQDVDPGIEVFAFADSDASSSPSWLRWMTAQLDRTPHIGAKTGYRWMVPANNSMATMIVCSINNSLASMLGSGNRSVVWGGSWGINRQIFEGLGIREAWKGKLSDDLVAARALRNARLKVSFVPRCLCVSDVRFSWLECIEFLRRQFLVTRTNLRHYWLFAVFVNFTTMIGFWGSLAIGSVLAYSNNRAGYWLLSGTALLYGLSIIKGMLRREMGSIVSKTWGRPRSFQLFDLFAGPITHSVTAFSLLLSMIGNQIRWRGIHYSIDTQGKVAFWGRDIDDETWQVMNAKPTKHPVAMLKFNSKKELRDRTNNESTQGKVA